MPNRIRIKSRVQPVWMESIPKLTTIENSNNIRQWLQTTRFREEEIRCFLRRRAQKKSKTDRRGQGWMINTIKIIFYNKSNIILSIDINQSYSLSPPSTLYFWYNFLTLLLFWLISCSNISILYTIESTFPMNSFLSIMKSSITHSFLSANIASDSTDVGLLKKS